MSDVITIEPATRLLSLRYNLPNNRQSINHWRKYPFTFVPDVTRAMATPLLAGGDDLAQPLLSIPIREGQQPAQPTLLDADSKQLRLFIQPAPDENARQGPNDLVASTSGEDRNWNPSDQDMASTTIIGMPHLSTPQRGSKPFLFPPPS